MKLRPNQSLITDAQRGDFEEICSHLLASLWRIKAGAFTATHGHPENSLLGDLCQTMLLKAQQQRGAVRPKSFDPPGLFDVGRFCVLQVFRRTTGRILKAELNPPNSSEVQDIPEAVKSLNLTSYLIGFVLSFE